MCAAFVSLLSRFFVNKWKMQSLKMKMKMIQCSENEKLNESGDSTLTYYRWTRKCSFERNNIGLIFLMHQWNLSGMGKLSVFFHHDHSILDFFKEMNGLCYFFSFMLNCLIAPKFLTTVDDWFCSLSEWVY